MNGRDKRGREKRECVGDREPVLKHGPNTACGGNARERAWVDQRGHRAAFLLTGNWDSPVGRGRVKQAAMEPAGVHRVET